MPAPTLALLAALALAACTNTAMTPGEIAGSTASGALERADDGDSASSENADDGVIPE